MIDSDYRKFRATSYYPAGSSTSRYDAGHRDPGCSSLIIAVTTGNMAG